MNCLHELHERRAAAIAFALTLAASTAVAQPGASPSAGERPPGMCWRGRPLPRCTTILLTEVTALTSVASTRADPHPVDGGGDKKDVEVTVGLTVGRLRNVSASRAHGFAVTAAGDGLALVPSLEWRNRFWHGTRRAFTDVGLGYTRRQVRIRPDQPNLAAHGAFVSISAAPVDLFALVGRAELLSSDARTHAGLSVGAQTGSYGTAVTGTGALLLAIAFAIAVVTSGYE